MLIVSGFQLCFSLWKLHKILPGLKRPFQSSMQVQKRSLFRVKGHDIYANRYDMDVDTIKRVSCDIVSRLRGPDLMSWMFDKLHESLGWNCPGMKQFSSQTEAWTKWTLQTTYIQMRFFPQNIRILTKISSNCAPECAIDSVSPLVRVMVYAEQTTSFYLNQWWPNSMTLCMSSLGHNDKVYIYYHTLQYFFDYSTDAIITSLSRQNDFATSFWRTGGVSKTHMGS